MGILQHLIISTQAQTLSESWWDTEQMLSVPGADVCDELVDDGDEATLVMQKGTIPGCNGQGQTAAAS